MGLFDSVRGLLDDEESADPSDELSAAAGTVPRLDVRDPTPMDFRNKAVDAVGAWAECDLDYSAESLERLDAFARKQGARLDVIREDSDDGGERVADMHTGFTIRAGSYLGEVLVREFDGEWTEDGDHWAVTVPTGEEARTVDVFEVASHAFAEEPVFTDLAAQLGADLGEDDEAEAADEDVNLRPDFRPDAEEFAAFWDAYDLDFSAVSLARLDVLVESEWADDEFDGVEAGGEDMDSKMYTELLKQLGCYYGEVLVRELDAEWTRRSDAVVVVVPGAEGESDITVPVFDVAEVALTGSRSFAHAITAVAEDAGREAPAVPTREPDRPAGDDSLDGIPDDEPADATQAPDVPVDDSPATGGSTDESPDENAERSESLSPAEIVGIDDGGEASSADTGLSETTSTDATALEEEPPAAVGSGDDAATDPADESVEPPTGGSNASATDESDSEPESDGPTGSMDDVIPHADGSDETTESADDSGGDDSEPEALDLDDGTGTDEGLTPDGIQEDAVAFAATWPGQDLDFSPESLERLDALVAEEYSAEDVPDVDLPAANAADSGYLAARVVEAGGYFAEVLRRTVGGRWHEGEEGLVFVANGQSGEARFDPAAVATDCFRGEDSFAARYAVIRSQIAPS
ncbi:hypothetical protein [Halorientalis salina]|uniref:hypothetical protein n=1 Tax=Halorientalis salina TaxID=2932266 RepID=UPI0010AC7AE3|nr:hypothetical protein [Halorientalis salina]